MRNLLLTGALATVAALVLLVYPVQTLSASMAFGPAINWGLSPNTREQTPAAPSGARALLEQYNGLYVADTDKKHVYLTFDLGYEAGHTAEVLDILREHNLKAIFFLCGHYLAEETLVNRMINEGHLVGNHTDKHKDLPTLSDEGVKTDIMTVQTRFGEKYPGTPMTFFRPPKGRIDEKTLRIAHENNLRTMMWSIAIVDWGKTQINAKASADKIAGRLHPGAIILLHITNAGTPKMLRLLIPKIAEKGYEIANPALL